MEKPTAKNTIAEHLNELRMRLFWCALVFIGFSALGYALHDTLLVILQRPLGSVLYYTSPTGGFDFIFKISMTFGVLFSMPVIVYHVMKFIKPAYDVPRKLVIFYGFGSMLLAILGACFAYFVSLPASLNFLGEFGGEAIAPIITATEYFNFALAYIGGFAALFQLILIIAIINRIKPLKPLKMLKLQRYLIVGSFIVAAILTPTPDPINQAIMAVPIVLMYQVGILYVWIVNASKTRQATSYSKQPLVSYERRATALSFMKNLQFLAQTVELRREPLVAATVSANYRRSKSTKSWDVIHPMSTHSTAKKQRAMRQYQPRSIKRDFVSLSPSTPNKRSRFMASTDGFVTARPAYG